MRGSVPVLDISLNLNNFIFKLYLLSITKLLPQRLFDCDKKGDKISTLC